jgi:phosphoribosylanthranilate isomerase
MTWVKICGTTNLEDALTAVDAGADAVGFVFYEKSPRNISVEVARAIVEKLPESVEKIGVFVNGDGPDPIEILLNGGLTGIQEYISTENSGMRRGGAIEIDLLPKRARFLMALPLKLFGDEEQIHAMKFDFTRMRQTHAGTPLPHGLMDTFVLDSGDVGRPGGTGRTFDWGKAVPIAQAMRQGGVNLVVAGGLTPENVNEAIEILKPWGVDVVSGVEERPGKKDPAKVRAFVKAVREMDRKAS